MVKYDRPLISGPAVHIRLREPKFGLRIEFVLQVTFPSCVKWLVLEFDPQCGTAQTEDSLQLYIPSLKPRPTAKPSAVTHEAREQQHHDVPLWPVLKKYHGTSNWPSTALILPGNPYFRLYLESLTRFYMIHLSRGTSVPNPHCHAIGAPPCMCTRSL